MKTLRQGLLTLLIVVLTLSGAVQAQNDDTFTIGVFNVTTRLEPVVEGFFEGMSELGYIEGEDVQYLYEGTLEEMTSEEQVAVAQALIDAQVDLILTVSTYDAEMFMEMTAEIPVVFCLAIDPVGAGLVESLTRPGGNITGIDVGDYHQRQLQLLVEIDPAIELVYYPYNPASTNADAILVSLEEMADSLEVEFVSREFTDVEGAAEAYDEIPEEVDAILVSADPEYADLQIGLRVMAVANRHRLPVSIPTAMAVPGLLMGYGPDIFDAGIQVAGMVDRILRGADPAELPVENAEYFLLVNLEAAEAIGLEVPRRVLRQANLIIRPGDMDDIDLLGGGTGEDQSEGNN